MLYYTFILHVRVFNFLKEMLNVHLEYYEVWIKSMHFKKESFN